MRLSRPLPRRGLLKEGADLHVVSEGGSLARISGSRHNKQSLRVSPGADRAASSPGAVKTANVDAR